MQVTANRQMNALSENEGAENAVTTVVTEVILTQTSRTIDEAILCNIKHNLKPY